MIPRSPATLRQLTPGPFNLVSQGGGDFQTAHRCAGEWMTEEFMKTAVRLLVTAVLYDWPGQDLNIECRHPCHPRKAFVISNVWRGLIQGESCRSAP
jgi:fatty-acid peroxygenase